MFFARGLPADTVPDMFRPAHPGISEANGVGFGSRRSLSFPNVPCAADKSSSPRALKTRLVALIPRRLPDIASHLPHVLNLRVHCPRKGHSRRYADRKW